MEGGANYKNTTWPLTTDAHSWKTLKGLILTTRTVHSVIDFLLPTTLSF